MENENNEQMTLEEIESAIDAIEVDNTQNENDNAAIGDADSKNNLEKIAELENLVSAQNDKIERITKQLGKMVTIYGARLSGDNTKIEEFKSLSVEPKFEDKTDDIPNLEDIQLS